MTSEILLSVDNLGVRRSERWLFRGLSFTLSAGEIVQVVGPNGSGKTSLLRTLSGLLMAAEGQIRWSMPDEEDIPLFIGHLPGVKPELSVFENLSLHPIGGQFADSDAIEKAIVEVRLAGYEDIPARHLSAGQTRRVALARLLLSKTRCWVLDEPFTSLDVEGCAWLEQQMTQFIQGGGAVLLTSHQPLNMQNPPRMLPIPVAEDAYAD